MTESKEKEAKYGLRFNQGKVDLTQLSPLSAYLESLVFMMGENKYGRDNWKNGKPNIEDTFLEMKKSIKRHWNWGYLRGEWLDKESGMPHLAHMVWNINRIMDFYYWGQTHMKDGKDLFHQPFAEELPPIPQKKEAK